MWQRCGCRVWTRPRGCPRRVQNRRRPRAMIVLDASAAIEWLLRTPKASAIEARLFAKSADASRWHVPHLLDVEVAQVLRKQVAKGVMSDVRGHEALQDFLDLPLARYP